GDGIRAGEQAERTAGFLEANAAALGPWVHGERFVTHLWPLPRAIEYDAGASTGPGALEHEVFHSWWARGIKPASAADGWIDEAYTTWSTSDNADRRRYAAIPLSLDEAPAVLAPASPWSRHTPTDAYTVGYRLFAGIAHLSD